MIITYDKTYKVAGTGINWKLYSDVGFKDSLIVHQLLSFVKENPMIGFSKIAGELRKQYQNKKVRSRCSIVGNSDRIEIIVKGVFPRFYIERNICYK